MRMGDKDAIELRRLLSVHGFPAIILELYRISSAYARHQPRWFPVKRAFKRAYVLSTGGIKHL